MTESSPAPSEEPTPTFHDPFDPDYTREVATEVFGPIVEHYFRPRLIGAHKLTPAGQGPAILAPNHSGSAFPYDALLLDAMIWHRDGYRPEAKCRSVFEPQLAMTWWMNPFGLDNFWRRCGGVDMTFDNYSRLLERGDRVVHYPEGVPGIGKGFNKRYQLQRYSSSLVVMAARHNAPIHPIHVVNAEWVIPFGYMVKPLNHFLLKFFGVPYLPLPAGPLGILFPWAWYLATPCRMLFHVGDTIDVKELARARGLDPDAIEDLPRETLRELADDVRKLAQAELDRYVARAGRWPYQWRSLKRHWKKAKGERGALFPWSWSFRMVRHARDRVRPPAKNKLHGWLRDWDVLGFYLPFGWFFLALTRALRRPPYGFRGLDKKERRRRQGFFLWRLMDDPLPPKG